MPNNDNNDVHQDLNESPNLPAMDYNLRGDARTMAVILKMVHDLQKKIHQLETEKIIDETQLPKDTLEENNLLPSPPQKLKRGRGYRPLLKNEITEAQSHAVNEAAAARWLGVSFSTYKKYAKLYGVYDPKQFVRGKRSIFDPNRGKYPLIEILEGKHPNVSIWTVKDKLIRSGMKKLECEMCGFSQRRLGDNKVPLLLNHMDGNTHNHRLDNLKLLCLNCTFLAGRGYIRRSKYSLDPDWMQDQYRSEMGKPSRY